MLKPATTKQDHQNRKRLAKLRGNLNMSLADFAVEIGKGVRMVRYYESGEQFVPAHVVKLIDYIAKEREAVKDAA